MRASTSAPIVVLAAAAGAMAQASPTSIAQAALSYLSPGCQATVLQLVNSSSPIYQCLHVDSLLPAILTNDSFVPPVDMYLSTVCSSDPCSATTLNTTAQMIISGCSTDLANFKVSNNTVYEVMAGYPLAREVACLKTTAPLPITNATIPLNSTAYNSTNGTFCVTEAFTELSAYLGTNLTNSYVDTLVLGGNSTALQILEMIPPSAICSDCVFAAVDLIEAEYPSLGGLVVNSTTNATFNSYLNGTCAAESYNVTSNGTLPGTIFEAAENSTFPLTVVAGNATFTPASGANATVMPTGSLNATAVIGSLLSSVTGGAATSTAAATSSAA